MLTVFQRKTLHWSIYPPILWRIDSIPQSREAVWRDFTFLSWPRHHLLVFTVLTDAHTHKTSTGTLCCLPTPSPSQPRSAARLSSSHHLFGLVDIWPEPTLKYYYRVGGGVGGLACPVFFVFPRHDDTDILRISWTCRVSAKERYLVVHI